MKHENDLADPKIKKRCEDEYASEREYARMRVRRAGSLLACEHTQPLVSPRCARITLPPRGESNSTLYEPQL